jgi:hypothetical protein
MEAAFSPERQESLQQSENSDRAKEQAIDNIFAEIELIDVRILKHQQEIDRLRADTKKSIANLTSIIK